MDAKIEKFSSMGVDVKSALERFLDDEELYLDCVDKMLEDENFDKLKTALEVKDINSGFDAAHTLKGVFANMGFDPLLNEVVQIVEPLRAKTDEGCMAHYEKMCEIRDEFLKV